MTFNDMVADESTRTALLNSVTPVFPPAYEMQHLAISYICLNYRLYGRSSMLAVTMGQGKTYAALMAYIDLVDNGDIKGKLLFCVPTANAVKSVEASVAKFTELRSAILTPEAGLSCIYDNSIDVVIVTYASLTRSKYLLKLKNSVRGCSIQNDATERVRYHIGMVVADEIHNAKNEDTITFKVMNGLINGSDRRVLTLGMSGTMVSRAADLSTLWAEMMLIDGGETLSTSFQAFVNSPGMFRTVKTAMTWARKGSFVPESIKYVPTAIAKGRLEELIAPYLIAYEPQTDGASETSLDIRRVETGMTPLLTQSYESLYARYTQRGGTDNKAVLHAQLLRLSSGVYYSDDADASRNSVPYSESAKARSLKNRLPTYVATGNKIIVFYHHTGVLPHIKQAFSEQSIPLLSLVSGQDRETMAAIRDKFVTDPKHQFLAMPYQIGAESLNFEHGGEIVVSGLVCYELSQRAALMRQAWGRVTRIGQRKKPWCEFLIGSPMESKTLDKLLQSKDFNMK